MQRVGRKHWKQQQRENTKYSDRCHWTQFGRGDFITTTKRYG